MSETQKPLVAPVRRGPPPAKRAPLPVVLRPRYLILAGLLGGAIWLALAAIDEWRSSRTTFRVVSAIDATIDQVDLEFFELDDRQSGPSPTRRISDRNGVVAGKIVVGWDDVPGEALVRVRAPGHGIGFGHVRSGRSSVAIRVGSAVPQSGRVVLRLGETEEPVEGARVQAFGGGPRGVLLREAVTEADGSFEMDGISDTVAGVLFRVTADGFAVFERQLPVDSGEREFALRRTRAVVGRVVGPEGVSVSNLEIRVYRLPGVSTRTDENGAFRLDHLPPAPTRCTLLLTSLPDELTHARSIASAGDEDLEIVVRKSGTLRGVALDRGTRQPIPNVKIFHDHGPAGMEIVDCDSSGRFVIGRVPPGQTRLSADVLVEHLEVIAGQPVRRKRVRGGYVVVEIDEGGVQDQIILAID